MVQTTATKTKQAQSKPGLADARSKTPGKHRSRSGCLTCKQKHVKCDETRPTCRKCAQKGWVCGGYSSGIKWSYKHQPISAGHGAKRNSPGASQRADPGFNIQVVDFSKDEGIVPEPAPFDNMFSPAFLLSPDPVQDDGDHPTEDTNLQIQLPSSVDSQADDWSVDGGFMAPTIGQPTPPDQTASPEMISQDLCFPGDHYQMIPQVTMPLNSSPDGSPEATWRLINSWFDEVCPAWSGFDSSMNMNRKLAYELWDTSASVFQSLQSMSISFMSARMPHLKRPARRLLKTATMTIQAEVDSLSSRGVMTNVIPTGLMFSLFCLGTTFCWLDPSLVGAPFLEEARTLLRRTIRQCPKPNAEQQALFTFFKKSLVYWEMLVSVVDDTEMRGDGDVLLLNSHEAQSADASDDTSTDILPHPWTGISSMTSSLFSRSIRLCRTYRRRITNPTGRAISLSTAMREIQEAQKLEEKLLALDFSPVPQVNSDTGDGRTPWLHLAHVAEAYQLASLLQLYATFPDLVSIRLPHESDFSKEGDVPWDKWIIPLTFRLTSVLEQIPPDSGSKVIQPLLYICASAGLRYNLSTPIPTDAWLSNPDEINQMGGPSRRQGSSGGIMGYADQIDTDDGPEVDPASLPQVAIDIGNARNFIMRRLSILENTLQPKPIIVARDLVKAVWAAYDEEPAGCASVHWVDVMEKKNLRSLFG